ncbi:hypothetical protein [Nannocystis punicea]|uniref:Uncharacterized protein n=1 Tax=Nannocystis punicea TaxID=2995304 RepID=A0ABY7H454_9BACT|nr:hypothetical protein [Nannocystis poenicansa]WAS94050.1 hypothetical protein O0S08_48620 [Nannocystis poenicansa]
MSRDLGLALLLAGSAGCSPSRSDSATAGTGTTTTTTAETTTGATSTGSTTTAAASDPCSCYPAYLTCSDPPLRVCDAPEPCGELSEDAEEATICILGLLRDREPSRFHYDWKGGDGGYFGEFHVLAGGGGIDLECHTFGLTFDFAANRHTLEPADYFATCLTLAEHKQRLDCLLAGLHLADSFPECPDETG